VQGETTTNVSGGKYRIVAYADTASGPGALLAQTADIDAATSGAKTSALSLAAGTYWIGVHNISGVSLTFRSILAMNSFLPGVDAPGNNNLPSCWYTNPGVSIPNPWPTTGITRNGSAFSVYVQAA
jgi:hypothetical protein